MKEIELEFEMRYQFDSLRVVYCTEGIHKNRIQDIIVNADFDKHYKTIENWLKEKNIILTTPKAVAIIKAETGLTEEEIFETEKNNA